MTERKFKYEEIIEYIESVLDRNTLDCSRKLPSLRNISRQFNCAISVVMQAYCELEMKGLIRAEEKSGYFPVPADDVNLPEPQKYKHTLISSDSKTNSITGKVLENALDNTILPLGAAIPDESILPVKKLKNIIVRITREHPDLLCSYTSEKGDFALRLELTSLMAKRGIAVSPEEIIITNGCMEALSIAIQTATKNGDSIAVESPAFFGLIALLEELERKVIEIPTLPESGMDLNKLEKVFKTAGPAACIFSACFQNPLGYLMPDKNKQRLAELGIKYNVVLIEDDIYGECSFDGRPAVPAKSFDRSGNVIYCSSVSKYISPGLRIGWMVPGKRLTECGLYKLNRTLGGPKLLQRALSCFLKEGGYDYHLRHFRKNITRQTSFIRQLISRYFPTGTKISNPAGGFFL